MVKYYNVQIIPTSQAECNQLASLVHTHKMRQFAPPDPPFRVGQEAVFWSDNTYTTCMPKRDRLINRIYTVNEFAAVLNTGL